MAYHCIAVRAGCGRIRVAGMNIFSKLYLVLWAALIVVEIIAATTSYVPLDTMSENYWYIQNRSPMLVRAILTIGLVVLWVHLALKPGTIK
jgi:hypothetical protein